jgi:hypothetical protein
MFPTDFADKVIRKYSNPGDTVLDPFAGRATAVYSAAMQERHGIGIEVNPVGWVYGKAKLSTASESAVTSRVEHLARIARNYHEQAVRLPPFFHRCFSHGVREFLLAARDQLNWRYQQSDWTLMAILLVYLHGKRGQSFSNQMRQTKSMSPQYALRWWKRRRKAPPEIDPVDFLAKRITWRYAKGLPVTATSRVYLGDAVQVLPRLERSIGESSLARPHLLFTSPPYCGVTNYHYDQWLRLWLLGYPAFLKRLAGTSRGRFSNQDGYRDLLSSVFERASLLLRDDAIVYVRTYASKFTLKTTRQVLREAFPKKHLRLSRRPLRGPTQTNLFNDNASQHGEVDLILTP